MVEIEGALTVQVGSTVRYRSVRATEEWRGATALRLASGVVQSEYEVTIVASATDVGLCRLTPRSPLARALLGHQIGDRVEVALAQVSAAYVVTAIVTPPVAEAEHQDARSDGTVRVGSLVRVRGGDVGVEWWRIVPPDEADAMRRYISENTPFAKALMGHRVGEEVTAETPGGRWTVTIVGVESEGVWA